MVNDQFSQFNLVKLYPDKVVIKTYVSQAKNINHRLGGFHTLNWSKILLFVRPDVSVKPIWRLLNAPFKIFHWNNPKFIIFKATFETFLYFTKINVLCYFIFGGIWSNCFPFRPFQTGQTGNLIHSSCLEFGERDKLLDRMDIRG